MDWKAHIESRPGVLGGKPVIKGTRISVELIIENMASGWTVADVLAAYPHLTEDQVRAAFALAAASLPPSCEVAPAKLDS